MMVDPSEVILKTVDLSEMDITLVKGGNSVKVGFDAYPAESLRGTIPKITNWSDKYLGEVVFQLSLLRKN